MTARQNGTVVNMGKPDAEPFRKDAAEFVIVDKKTQKGYLTFYDIEEWEANAIIAVAAIIFRNCRQRPRNYA
jgi:hypothetical protein